MNPIHQWLEGKKKDPEHDIKTCETLDCDDCEVESTKSYNSALVDFKVALPSLLSAMEAEIREEIEKAKFRKNPDIAGFRWQEIECDLNKGLGIADTIIHQYFNDIRE